MDRYLSQRLYKNIGKKGQEKLKKASVCVVGIGGLGTICSGLLVRAGVGRITLFDGDIVDLSNLQRQVLYDEKDVGKPKAQAAKGKLSKINSEIEIKAESEDIGYKNVNLLGKPDIVITATDNMENKFLLNDYCLKNKIPLIYGGAIEGRGSIFTVIPGRACLRCIFSGSSGETSAQLGILNSCSSIIGSMMAGAAVKLIVTGESETDLIHFNVWDNSFSKIKVKKKKNCSVCKGN
jgi:molybdopterin/thiamine biosynthesis adenylyltransferase